MIYSVYTNWNFNTLFIACLKAVYNMLRIDRLLSLAEQRKAHGAIKAAFALIVCSGLIMVAAMAATLFMDVDGAWRATLVIVYTVSGIAGIVLIGRAFATSKRVPDTDEAASGISERESK